MFQVSEEQSMSSERGPHSFDTSNVDCLLASLEIQNLPMAYMKKTWSKVLLGPLRKTLWEVLVLGTLLAWGCEPRPHSSSLCSLFKWFLFTMYSCDDVLSPLTQTI